MRSERIERVLETVRPGAALHDGRSRGGSRVGRYAGTTPNGCKVASLPQGRSADRLPPPRTSSANRAMRNPHPDTTTSTEPPELIACAKCGDPTPLEDYDSRSAAWPAATSQRSRLRARGQVSAITGQDQLAAGVWSRRDGLACHLWCARAHCVAKVALANAGCACGALKLLSDGVDGGWVCEIVLEDLPHALGGGGTEGGGL